MFPKHNWWSSSYLWWKSTPESSKAHLRSPTSDSLRIIVTRWWAWWIPGYASMIWRPKHWWLMCRLVVDVPNLMHYNSDSFFARVCIQLNTGIKLPGKSCLIYIPLNTSLVHRHTFLLRMLLAGRVTSASLTPVLPSFDQALLFTVCEDCQVRTVKLIIE